MGASAGAAAARALADGIAKEKKIRAKRHVRGLHKLVCRLTRRERIGVSSPGKISFSRDAHPLRRSGEAEEGPRFPVLPIEGGWRERIRSTPQAVLPWILERRRPFTREAPPIDSTSSTA
jgi:hypothetical protein